MALNGLFGPSTSPCPDCSHALRTGGEPARATSTAVVKTPESFSPCGYDAGKKVKFRKDMSLAESVGRVLRLRLFGRH